MSRIFDNPKNVHVKILEKRLVSLDVNAVVTTFSTDIRNSDGSSTGVKRRYAAVDSLILTDVQIASIIDVVVDPSEQTYISEFDNDRVYLRTNYQTIYTRLVAIQSMGQSTNEIVTNIKYIAEQLAFILRMFNKLKFLLEEE